MRRSIAILLAVAASLPALPAQATYHMNPPPPPPPPMPAPGQPDLVVSQLGTWPPCCLQQGDIVRFTGNVTNVGNATAGNFSVTFFLDGNHFATIPRNSTLAPGETWAMYPQPWTATTGTHVLDLVADTFGQVPESNETNNTRRHVFEVAGQNRSDLVVVNLTLSPPNPQPGQPVTFQALVRNQGNASAGNFTVLFTVDGNFLGYASHNASLAPGQSALLTSPPWTAQPGNHTVRAFADAFFQVPESNEGNNEAVRGFEVGSPPFLPDLVLTGLSIAPNLPVAGQPMEFRAEVRNFGNSAAGNFTLRFSLNNAPLSYHGFNGTLGPGQAVLLTSASWNAQPGTHTVRAFADAFFQVPEGNESNNELAYTFTVPGLPDPALDALSVTKRMLRTDYTPGLVNPIAGQDVHVLVANHGNASTNGFLVNVTACTRLEPLGLPHCEAVEAVFVPPLAPGATREVHAFWDTLGKVGDWEVCAQVVYPWPQRTGDNDRRCAPTFVLVGGTGLGGFGV